MELILMIPVGLAVFVGLALMSVFWELLGYAIVIVGIVALVVEAIKYIF